MYIFSLMIINCWSWLLWGLPKLGVWRRNPSTGQSRPEQSERGMKRYKGWTTFWHTRCPIKGTRHPQASYLSPNREVLFTPLCGLASSHLGFLCRLPGKEVRNHLAWIWSGEGGALAPIWSNGEACALAGSHPRKVTQAPIKIMEALAP
jgi:hypothetical protein